MVGPWRNVHQLQVPVYALSHETPSSMVYQRPLQCQLYGVGSRTSRIIEFIGGETDRARAIRLVVVSAKNNFFSHTHFNPRSFVRSFGLNVNEFREYSRFLRKHVSRDDFAILVFVFIAAAPQPVVIGGQSPRAATLRKN